MKKFISIPLLLLGGCASAPSQQTQIAYAYSGVTASLNTLAVATTQGLLSSTEATQANQAILAVKATLDAANATSTPSAAAIAGGTAALANVATYLTCKQQKKTGCTL